MKPRNFPSAKRRRRCVALDNLLRQADSERNRAEPDATRLARMEREIETLRSRLHDEPAAASFCTRCGRPDRMCYCEPAPLRIASASEGYGVTGSSREELKPATSA